MDLLHSKGFLHSDISGDNIGFSFIYGTWKLFDFGNTMKINESLRKKRTCGTDDFIHPSFDAVNGGIYLEYMDIYSLLKVFDYAWLYRFRMANLYNGFCWGENVTKEMRYLFNFIKTCLTELVDAGKTSIKMVIEKILPLYITELKRKGKKFDITYINSEIVLKSKENGVVPIKKNVDDQQNSSLESIPITSIMVSN